MYVAWKLITKHGAGYLWEPLRLARLDIYRLTSLTTTAVTTT